MSDARIGSFPRFRGTLAASEKPDRAALSGGRLSAFWGQAIPRLPQRPEQDSNLRPTP